MAPKRKARDAFGGQIDNVSAFAAKQSNGIKTSQAQIEDEISGPLDATSLAQTPYDGHHHQSASDAESDAVDIFLGPSPLVPPSVRLSSFQANNMTKGEDDSLTLVLRNEESVACVGEYDVSVSEGIATIYGMVLHPASGPYHVFAPSTHALPGVVARRTGTVVKLGHVVASMRKLEHLSPLFRNIWSRNDGFRHTFKAMQSVAGDELQRSLVPLDINKATNAVLATLATEAESTARLTRIMAVGAKSSGKSTLNRILCNTLLSKPSIRKVVYLDLDPGQPEFTPPGQLSLVEVTIPILGPPFTHPASARSVAYKLLRSHSIAATSFRDEPAHYLACAIELIQHADRRYPLVVNACGWVSGVGASALEELLPSLDITQVVLMEPLEAVLIETLRSSSPDSKFHRIGRQPVRPTSRTPAESRSMQTQAYFHHRSSKFRSQSSCSDTVISNWRPWVVRYDGPRAGIQAVVSYGTHPHPNFLTETLNGSLVALVQVDKHHADEAYNFGLYGPGDATSTQNTADAAAEPRSASNSINRSPEGLPYLPPSRTGASAPLDPRYSECVGLALIRAIEPNTKTLHIVTPLSEAQIARLVDEHVVLVRGAFDAPDWAYLEDAASGVAEREDGLDVDRPWVSKTEAVGLEGAVWRLRHPPMPGELR
ncbi:Polynucleotide 5'-hydroxyl-kinase grc3 [Teratosphaeriaceae sp. CCFEE 6253]|nr:Polynucleotide 5'-hydroxyl-kinase grc3 [Teratosphaeriaceae sp. CCFEE 6253]